VRCARFELDVEIVNRVESGDGSFFANQVRVRGLPIAMGESLVLSGTKTHEYVCVTHSTCGVGRGDPLGPFSVTRLTLPLGDRPDGTPAPREVELDLTLGTA
jgi:hypothetical protein